MAPKVPRKKRSGPYMWEYIPATAKTWGPRKKVRSRKRTFRTTNLPQSAINLIAFQLGRNIGRLHLSAPSQMRTVTQPHFNRQSKIEKLRRSINFRGPVNTRSVNPSYIQIVRRLHSLNRTPNENYNMRGELSTGYHMRRIQSMQNLLGRLQRQNNNGYVNATTGNLYTFNSRRGHLTSVPANPQQPSITIATGLKRRMNGTLHFNTRRRKQQLRNR